jgi:predicted AAA+ superfamily ATPase
VRTALARSPIVAVLGPRQSGKTTLAREIAGADSTLFDLERSTDRQALSLAPEAVLEPLKGLVVLDEVQTLPGLLPSLRVLADRDPLPARFLILGSTSPDLIQGASETLAGRVAFVHLSGFDLTEVGPPEELWIRGGFPRSFLAPDAEASYRWRQDFIETFLSRDASRLGVTMPPEQLRRFWTMIAHLHGGQLNLSELARAFSIDQKTVGRYVDALAGTFLVRRLQPWFENTGKRLVKAPRIYLRDSGILHALLGLRTGQEVLAHPRFGASWEGFVVEQIISLAGAERDAFYWATHGGAELDLMLSRGGRRYGFEVKFEDAPRPTRSMRVALSDLGLERLFVVVPSERSYPLDDRIDAVAIRELASLARSL